MTAEHRPPAGRVEDLLEHAAWLRGLATALVRDAAEADDLVQETWLAAMRRPRPDGVAPRAWLTGVARNLAKLRLRGESRRSRRERVVAADECGVPSASELAERLNTQRMLASLVAEVPEAQRTIVLLRYFEGLTSAEIARRLGEPEGTVRWRLKTALDALRARLDERHRGGRAAWALLVGPLAWRTDATGTAAGSFAAGGIAMASATKLLTAAALLVVAGLGCWWLAADRAATDVAPPRGDTAHAEAPPVRGNEGGPQRDRVRADAAAASPVAELPGSDDRRKEPTVAVNSHLTGRVVDETTTPVAGATVRSTKHGVSATSGADGRFDLGIGVTDEFDLFEFEVSAPGFATRLVENPLMRDATMEFRDIVLAAGGTVTGRVVDQAGAGSPKAWVAVAEVVTFGAAPAGGDSLAFKPAGARTTTAADGTFELHGVAAGERRIVAGGDGLRTATTDAVVVRAGERTNAADIVVRRITDAERIQGRVVDERGNGVAKAVIQVRFRSARVAGTTSVVAGDDGVFSIDATDGGVYELVVREYRREWTSDPVAGLAAGAHDVKLVVRRASEPLQAGALEIEVTDSLGRPVERFGVWTFDGSRPLIAEDEDDRTGGKWAGAAPAARFRLEIAANGYRRTVLSDLDPAALPHPLKVVLVDGPCVSGVVRDGSTPREGATVEMQRAVAADRTATCGGFPMTRDGVVARATTDSEGRYRLNVPESGRYFLRVVTKDRPPADLGPLDLDPERAEPGRDLTLGAGGSIAGRVIGDGGASVAGAIVGASHGDGPPRVATTSADGSYRFDRLTPGDWMVRVLDGEPARLDMTVYTDGAAKFDWSCTVREAAATRHDVEAGAATRCVIRGRVSVSGVDGTRWHVALAFADPMQGDVVEVKAVGVATDGSFEMSLAQRGAHCLDLSGGDSAFRYLVPVTLAPGVQTPSIAVPLARLDIRAAEGADVSGLMYVAERDGGAVAYTSVHADASGAFAQRTVLAGAGRLVRWTKDAGNDPRKWPAVAGFTVSEGATAVVELR